MGARRGLLSPRRGSYRPLWVTWCGPNGGLVIWGYCLKHLGTWQKAWWQKHKSVSLGRNINIWKKFANITLFLESSQADTSGPWTPLWIRRCQVVFWLLISSLCFVVVVVLLFFFNLKLSTFALKLCFPSYEPCPSPHYGILRTCCWAFIKHHIHYA